MLEQQLPTASMYLTVTVYVSASKLEYNVSAQVTTSFSKSHFSTNPVLYHHVKVYHSLMNVDCGIVILVSYTISVISDCVHAVWVLPSKCRV